VTRILWVFFGAAALFIGLVGLILPLIPTVPFLLLAAFCFARSSHRLHQWLLTHPRLGPPILHWQQHGAIHRRAKSLAMLSISMAVCVSAILGVPIWLLFVQIAVLTTVALFIWTRPEE
jgi:uncharacterized membrane protein YbaN (DUF454 family)